MFRVHVSTPIKVAFRVALKSLSGDVTVIWLTAINCDLRIDSLSLIWSYMILYVWPLSWIWPCVFWLDGCSSPIIGKFCRHFTASRFLHYEIVTRGQRNGTGVVPLPGCEEAEPEAWQNLLKVFGGHVLWEAAYMCWVCKCSYRFVIAYLVNDCISRVDILNYILSRRVHRTIDGMLGSHSSLAPLSKCIVESSKFYSITAPRWAPQKPLHMLPIPCWVPSACLAQCSETVYSMDPCQCGRTWQLASSAACTMQK